MPTKRKKKAKAVRRASRRARASTRGARAAEIALANLAHDIRTPLGGILAMSELLLASDLPERERRWAATVRDAAIHLARLTTLVVDSARAGSADLVLQVEPFALRDLVDSVAQSLRARAEGKALEVKVSVANNLPMRVIGDPVRLRSALENLIDNAVKFTERGSVSLAVSSARAPRGRLRLTFVVADTGIGIIPADLKRLFRPFVQANEDVARRFGGAGLGLAFVKRIAQAMGGDVVVTSRPGRGSTFRLTVLVAPEAGKRAAAGRRKNESSLRILCVEDNPYGRVVLNTVLGEFGHRVDFVGSGEAAVETVARGGHDVVLMDVELPGIGGLEAVRRIRALPGAAALTPVIGVSGRSGAGDATAARAAGMDGYLHKPVSPQQLQSVLADITAEPARRERSST